MKNSPDEVYSFVFRGLLAEEALDRVGRQSKILSESGDAEIAKSLSLDLLDEDLVREARRMWWSTLPLQHLRMRFGDS